MGRTLSRGLRPQTGQKGKGRKPAECYCSASWLVDDNDQALPCLPTTMDDTLLSVIQNKPVLPRPQQHPHHHHQTIRCLHHTINSHLCPQGFHLTDPLQGWLTECRPRPAPPALKLGYVISYLTSGSDPSCLWLLPLLPFLRPL